MTYKILRPLGFLVILLGIVFLLVDTLVSVSDGKSVTDIFGLSVPKPPIWTGYIPFLGYGIGLAFESFSLHGLVSIGIFWLVVLIGYSMIRFTNSKPNVKTSID